MRHYENKDITLVCKQCERPFGWWDQLGMRTCRTHPGRLIASTAPAQEVLVFSCCGWAPVMMDGRHPTVGVQMADARGCTPCDHLAGDEDRDQPVYVWAVLKPPHGQAVPANDVAQQPRAQRMQWACYHQPGVFQRLPPALQVEVQGTFESAGRVPSDLERVLSWLPRERTMPRSATA